MLAKNRNRVSCQEIVKFSERWRALICCECEFMQSPLRGNRSALKLAARSAASASLCNRRLAAIALRSNLLLAPLPPCHCAPCSIVLPKKEHPIFTNKSSSVKEFESPPHDTSAQRTKTNFIVVPSRSTITTDNAFCAIYAIARVRTGQTRCLPLQQNKCCKFLAFRRDTVW